MYRLLEKWYFQVASAGEPTAVQARVPQPDYESLARGLAQVQDFRLVYYVLIVIIIMLIIERWTAAAGMRKERQEMWKVADKFSDAAKEFSEQTDKLVIELQVLRALTARVESKANHDDRG